MKLFEHREKEKALERLPDLPPGVEVPDDISGIEPPTTKPTTGGVRWMHWLAAFVLIGTAGLVTVMQLRSDDTVDSPDLMAEYGTDNPAFVDGSPGPRVVQIGAAGDLMERWGTDNPTFVPDAAAPNTAVDLMAMYGTDNPAFVQGVSAPGTVEIVGNPGPSHMDLYGTDNPVFVDGPSVADHQNAGDYMTLYGTDNPVFVDGPSPMELYGTDNPVFVD